jgi:mRNA degradation ribonuclease J1/J2
MVGLILLSLSQRICLGIDRLVPSQYPTIQGAINAAVSGDTVVISGSVIPGHERTVADTVNNLFRLGADVIYGGEGADIHTSGRHSDKPGLLWLSEY